MIETTRRDLYTVGLGVLGLVGNLLSVPLFFGADFLFGGVFSLIPALLYGPLHGFVAAGLAAMPTFWLWGQPYALVTFSLEGLVLGWWSRRHREMAVEGELLYWLPLGFPLVLLTYGGLLHLPLLTTLMVAMKQAFNGVVNAVTASAWLGLSGAEARLNPESPSTWPMRSYLIHILTVAVLVPVMLAAAWFGAWYFHHWSWEAGQRAIALGESMAGRVRIWAEDHMNAVAGIAQGASPVMNQPERLQRWLTLEHRATPDFHNLYIADAFATTVAFHPPENSRGRPTIGLSFADRGYVQQAREARGPFVTPVFQGRGGTNAVISAVVAPIRDPQSRFLGYALGAVDLHRIQERIMADTAFPGATGVLVDDQGQVVFSTCPRWKPLDAWRLQDLGEKRPLGDGLDLVLPAGGSELARWQRGYLTWQTREAHTGWTVVVLLPMSSYVTQLFSTYLLILSVALFLMVPVLVISRWASHWITCSLERLAAAAESSPEMGMIQPWSDGERVLEVQALAQALERAVGRFQTLNAELEERVAQRTAELKAVNRELESFAYSVSHDLRAPLRAISGFSRALAEGYGHRLEPEAAHYLNRVQSATARMTLLIDALLELSRVGRGPLHRVPVDLSAVANAILAELQQAEPQREVQVVVTSGIVVDGDRDLLEVALRNLLHNAWKFTRHRATARIVFGVMEQRGDRTYFVQDNGAGFDPRHSQKLFTPFQRLHTQDEFPGTGVGLATVARIVRRHGGRIWAEGAVDEGATFYFTLSRDEGSPWQS